jgi:prepilin signal peptidase PulO-like enzyme (type II secretory pathway)
MSFNPFPTWITLIWPAVLALIGLCISPALNWLAETVHRRHLEFPAIPHRAVWLAIVTALLFGLAGWRFGLTLRAGVSCLYIAVLVLVTATDLEHRLIPNRFILPAILFALAVGFVATWMTWKASLLGGAVGLVFFAVAYGLAAVVYPGKIGLGMGDVTLATFIGLAVGFPAAIVAVVLGVLMGGLVSVLLLVTRRVTLQSALPYGPYLVIGGLVALFWGQAILKWYLRM